MKKIVSAMALSALVLSAASAELKLNINYRNGMNLYTGTNTGDGQTETKVTMFDQDGYNGGKDSVTFAATGDIFNFKTILQPTVVSDTIVFNTLEIGATYGLDDLGVPGKAHAMLGWWRDGSANGNIRITTDASSFEGADWEGAKPGSIFKNRPNTFVIDMTNMSISDTLIGGIFDYTLPTDAMSLKVLASVMTDRAAQKTGDLPNTAQLCDGAYTWGININAKLPGVVEIEALAKGSPKWNAIKNEDGDYAGAFTAGLYAMPLMVNGLKLAVGGSMGMVDGTLSDLAFDLRANYKVNDALSITSYNNLSIVKENVAVYKAETTVGEGSTGVGGDNLANASLVKDIGPTAMTGTMALWNMIGVAYKVNPTVTGRLSIAQQTMLDRELSKKNADGDDYKMGTAFRITPAVELTATKGASIIAGVTCAVSGIGADETYGKADTKTTIGEDLNWYWGIPVLFRVKM